MSDTDPAQAKAPEMVERLARTAAMSFHGPTEIEAAWPRYIPLVLSILASMREPTLAMTMSGAVDFLVTSSAKRAWRGMIDVARTDQPSELDETGDEGPA